MSNFLFQDDLGTVCACFEVLGMHVSLFRSSSSFYIDILVVNLEPLLASFSLDVFDRGISFTFFILYSENDPTFLV